MAGSEGGAGGSSGVWSVSDCSNSEESDEDRSDKNNNKGPQWAERELKRRLGESQMELRSVKEEQEWGLKLAARLDTVATSHNLLLTGCWLADLLRAAPGLLSSPRAIAPARSSTESTGNREQLQLEIEKLKFVKEELEKSQEQLAEEKTERIMMLEEKVDVVLNQARKMKDHHDKEKRSLENHHKTVLAELSLKEQNYSARVGCLENILDEIEHELCASSAGSGQADILGRLRLLIENESKLSGEMLEHEKKDAAFRETLAEADIIMASIENNYKAKLTELEEVNNHLQNKISHHLETERALRGSLQACSQAGTPPADLLDTILDKGKEDMEKIFCLEKSITELNMKISSEEKEKLQLKNSLKDQDQLSKQMQGFAAENKELLEEIQRNNMVLFKHAELQTSEEFLRGRVFELEQVEQQLRESMTELKQLLAGRERRHTEEVERLQEELAMQSHSVSSIEQVFM